MAKVHISLLMVDHMMGNGRIIKWMAKDYLNGQMAENIQDNTKMILKMVKVPLSGQMVDVMQGIGKMERNMVREFIQIVMEMQKKVSGKKENGRNGFENYSNLYNFSHILYYDKNFD